MSDDDDYIPESLRLFVAQAQMTQESVLSLISDEMSVEEIEKPITEDYDATLIDLPPSPPAPLLTRSSMNQLTQPSSKRTAHVVPLTAGPGTDETAAVSKRSSGGRVGTIARSKKVGFSRNVSHLRRLLNSSSSKSKNQQQHQQHRRSSSGIQQHHPASICVVPLSAELDTNSEPSKRPSSSLIDYKPETSISDRATKAFAERLKSRLSPPPLPQISLSSGAPSSEPISNVAGTLSLPHIVPPTPPDAASTTKVIPSPISPGGAEVGHVADPAGASDPFVNDGGGMSEDEVPEPLRSLFEKADQALRQTQQEIVDAVSGNSTISEASKDRLLLVEHSASILSIQVSRSSSSKQHDRNKAQEPQMRRPGHIYAEKATEFHHSHHCADGSERTPSPLPDSTGVDFTWQIDIQDTLLRPTYTGKTNDDKNLSPRGGPMGDLPLSESTALQLGETGDAALSRELEPILVPVPRWCVDKPPRWDEVDHTNDARSQTLERPSSFSFDAPAVRAKIKASYSTLETVVSKANDVVPGECPLKRQWEDAEIISPHSLSREGRNHLATTVESLLAPKTNSEDLGNQLVANGGAGELSLCDPSTMPAIGVADCRLEPQRFAADKCSQDVKIGVPNPRLDAGLAKSAAQSDEDTSLIPSSHQSDVLMSTGTLLLAPVQLRKLSDSFDVISSPSNHSPSTPRADSSVDCHGEELRPSIHGSSSLAEFTVAESLGANKETPQRKSEPSLAPGFPQSNVTEGALTADVSREVGQLHAYSCEKPCSGPVTLLSSADPIATVSPSVEVEGRETDCTGASGLRVMKSCDEPLTCMEIVVDTNLYPIKAETESEVGNSEQRSHYYLSGPVLDELHEEKEDVLTKLEAAAECNASEYPNTCPSIKLYWTGVNETLPNHEGHGTARCSTMVVHGEDATQRNEEVKLDEGIDGRILDHAAHDYPAESNLVGFSPPLHSPTCSSSGLKLSVNARNVDLHASSCSSDDKHIVSYMPACCSPVQGSSQCSVDQPTDLQETDSEESSLPQPPSIVQVTPHISETPKSSPSIPRQIMKSRERIVDNCSLAGETGRTPGDYRMNDQVSSTLTESCSGNDEPSAIPSVSKTEERIDSTNPSGLSPTLSSFQIATYDENNEIVGNGACENSPNELFRDNTAFGANFLSASFLAFVKRADEVLSQKQTDFLCCGQEQLSSVASQDPDDVLFDECAEASEIAEPPDSMWRMFTAKTTSVSAEVVSTIPVEDILMRDSRMRSLDLTTNGDHTLWNIDASQSKPKADDIKLYARQCDRKDANASPREEMELRNQPIQTCDSTLSGSVDGLVQVDTCVRMSVNEEAFATIEASGLVDDQEPSENDYNNLEAIQAPEASIDLLFLENVVEVDVCIEMSLDEGSNPKNEILGIVNGEEFSAGDLFCVEAIEPFRTSYSDDDLRKTVDTMGEDGFSVGKSVEEKLIPRTAVVGAPLVHCRTKSDEVDPVESLESTQGWTEDCDTMHHEMISEEIRVEPCDTANEAYRHGGSVREAFPNAEIIVSFLESASVSDKPTGVGCCVEGTDENEFVTTGRTETLSTLPLEESLLLIDSSCPQERDPNPDDGQNFRPVEMCSPDIIWMATAQELAVASEVPLPPIEATNTSFFPPVYEKSILESSPEVSELGLTPDLMKELRKDVELSIEATIDATLSCNEMSDDSSGQLDIGHDSEKLGVSVDRSAPCPLLLTQSIAKSLDVAQQASTMCDDSCPAQDDSLEKSACKSIGAVESNDRTKQGCHSPRYWKSANQRRAEEARAKAVERIRQRKLKERQSSKEANENQGSKASSRKSTYVPEEGVARAIRRMKAFRKAELANAAGCQSSGVARKQQYPCVQSDIVTSHRRMSQSSRQPNHHTINNYDRRRKQWTNASALAGHVQTRSSFIIAPKRSIKRCFGRDAGSEFTENLKATTCRTSPEIMTARSVEESKRDSRNAESLDSDLQPSKTFPSYMKPTKSSDFRRGLEPSVLMTHDASMATSSRVLQNMLRSDRPVVMNTGLWKWYARPLAPRKPKSIQTRGVKYETR